MSLSQQMQHGIFDFDKVGKGTISDAVLNPHRKTCSVIRVSRETCMHFQKKMNSIVKIQLNQARQQKWHI